MFPRTRTMPKSSYCPQLLNKCMLGVWIIHSWKLCGTPTIGFYQKLHTSGAGFLEGGYAILLRMIN